MSSSDESFQTTTAWCSHCKRFSNAVCDGFFISCVTCGKVLGDFSEKFFPGRGKSHERERGILKIKFNRKVSTEASDQASTTTQMSSRKTKVIRHNVSLQMDDSSSEGSTTNLPET